MRNKTLLRPPFNGEWLTFWGGDTIEINRHHGTHPQDYAFDFVIADSEGRWHKGKGDTNEQYYSYGKDILSPAAGKIVEACDTIRDNPPGILNNYAALGNFVLIEHTKTEYSLLAHLRQGSLKIKAGALVKQGQKIGECGNSGHSTSPHLHYHLQNSDRFLKVGKDFKKPIAKGIKIYFGNVIVNGQIRKDYSPVKGDQVKCK